MKKYLLLILLLLSSNIFAITNTSVVSRTEGSTTTVLADGKTLATSSDSIWDTLYKTIYIPVNAGWGTGATGTGTGQVSPIELNIWTGTTANSSSRRYFTYFGNDGSLDVYRINYAKNFEFEFTLSCALDASTETIRRVQIKLATTEGALADKGVGIMIRNLTMYGESYNTVCSTIALNTTLTARRNVRVKIKFTAGSKVEWFINNNLVGTETTQVPANTVSTDTQFVVSIINGNTAHNPSINISNIYFKQLY